MTGIAAVLRFRTELWLPNTIDSRTQLFFTGGNATRDQFFLCPHKSGTWAACLSQVSEVWWTECWQEHWHAGEETSYAEAVPTSCGGGGISTQGHWVRSGNGGQHCIFGPSDGTFRMTVTQISGTTCQGTVGQTQPITVFLWFGWEPIPQIMRLSVWFYSCSSQ